MEPVLTYLQVMESGFRGAAVAIQPSQVYAKEYRYLLAEVGYRAQATYNGSFSGVERHG
jgi:hypothetical protein